MFLTRTPEPPDSPSISIIPATTPDILFRNFKLSIEEKILENYLSCFVDQSFLNKKYFFISSAGSASQFPVLVAWGIEAERQYFISMKSRSLPGRTIILTLYNQVNTPHGDSAIYQLDYSISIASKDQNINGEYKGSAQFKIYRDSRQQWVIVQWDDIRKNDVRSWSDLKGRLY